VSSDVSGIREIDVVTLVHFHITLLCPCEMFWGLTEFYPELIVSNSDSVSAEEEVESKHLEEAMREAGSLPVPGLSTPRPRSRNILARPVQSLAGFLPCITPNGR